MLTIDDKALELIHKKNLPLSIEPLRSISGCCIEITESPAINFGAPKGGADYSKQSVQGVTVYVPSCFPSDGDYVIRTRNFFGFRQLILDGWRLA